MITRRGVLLSGAAAACIAAPTPQLVDTHIHLYDPARSQGVPWPPKADALLYRRVLPEDYERVVRPLGVTGAIVVEASAWLEDNQWVLDLAKENPMILGVVGHLEPGTPEFAGQLMRFAKDPLFRGIRLNGGAILAGLPRPDFVEDMRRLAGAGLTLDAIGKADMIAGLLALHDKLPSLGIVIDHMPVEPPGWHEDRSRMRELSKRPPVYAKVSGVLRREEKIHELSRYRESLDEVVELFGMDRVMYGSNWPVSDKIARYQAGLRVARDYFTGRDARSKFFVENSRKCYGWRAR